ncbi:MAG: PilZ domain-containing protein [Pseudomonadota bacterium]
MFKELALWKSENLSLSNGAYGLGIVGGGVALARRKQMNGDEKADLPPLAERRSAAARKKVLFGGIAVHPLGGHAANCQVREISDKGARIAISRAKVIPERLHLIIVRDQHAYEARIVWRKGDEAGLSFSKVIDLRAPSNPAFRHLAQICAQQKTDHLIWR